MNEENKTKYLIVKAEIKARLHENNLSISKEALEELNNQVRHLVRRAAERTLTNNRKTLQARDF